MLWRSARTIQNDAERLAARIGGRVAASNLRTGLVLRRTWKVVSNAGGMAWECYVTARPWELWIQNYQPHAGLTALAVNARAPGMGALAPVHAPFERLPLRVYAAGVDRDDVAATLRAWCRRNEEAVASLHLRSGERLLVTQHHLGLRCRRPDSAGLERQVAALERLFRDR